MRNKVSKSNYNYKYHKEVRSKKLDYTEKNRAACKKRYYSDPEKWRKRNRANYQKNKSIYAYRNRSNQIKKEYGITLEEYKILLESQNYKCQICLCDISGLRKARLDHCHKTGKIRAFLCHGCNVGIGFLKDDPQLCVRASEYLERYK